jgi:hypothetical protein
MQNRIFKLGPIGRLSALLVSGSPSIERLRSSFSTQLRAARSVSLDEIGVALPEKSPVLVWEGRIEWNGETAAKNVRNLNRVSRDDDIGERAHVYCTGKETSGNTVERVQDFTAGWETRSKGNACGPGQIGKGIL